MSISIHALREESDIMSWENKSPYEISIHALREESDGLITDNAVITLKISIHALREESDLMSFSTVIQHMLFQSTLSVRRATNP